MQPKLLGFRVSQHQQTRFSDITGEIEIATMYVQIVQGPHDIATSFQYPTRYLIPFLKIWAKFTNVFFDFIQKYWLQTDGTPLISKFHALVL